MLNQGYGVLCPYDSNATFLFGDAAEVCLVFLTTWLDKAGPVVLGERPSLAVARSLMRDINPTSLDWISISRLTSYATFFQYPMALGLHKRNTNKKPQHHPCAPI
jgi:hypothetical protein